MTSEQAKDTIRAAVLMGMTDRAHRTGLRAGRESDMILDDIMRRLLEGRVREALGIVGASTSEG